MTSPSQTAGIMEAPFVTGGVPSPVGTIPAISPALGLRDRLGTLKARLGIGRMRYAVPAGLYAIGSPDEDAPVLVAANYKMSFDRLREVLEGRHLWILVLDTKGINVWCAAGKGTFSTDEIVERVERTGLGEVVAHRKLIVPQLGAPGVAAHEVKRRSRFRVIYGPVRAADLPAFLDAGLEATPQMRRKTFTLAERAAVAPVELVQSLKHLIPVALLLLFAGGLGGPGTYWEGVAGSGLTAVLMLLGAVIGGTILVPLLLPWLPGRAFSLKGLSVGVVMTLAVLFLRGAEPGTWSARLEIAAWALLAPALTAYLALNFTGASTYTSLSGVRREMRVALPFLIAAGGIGLALWTAARFIT